MTVIVNGTATDVRPDTTIATLVAQVGRAGSGAGIAVALNGEVVPRTAWASTGLGEHDRVEVLGAAQGG